MIRRIGLRSLILCAWVIAIAAVLYRPKFLFLSSNVNTVNVFAWSDILHPDIIADFEKETGIRVRFNYYSSNEELLVKLKATKGEGYDLIIPSDYAVGHLVKEGLLQKIDKSRLSFWKDIDPRLLDHTFDPGNIYSIPFEWEIFIFLINAPYFAEHPVSPGWNLVFEPKGYKIAMTSDPVEATCFASFYLFGSTPSLSPEQTDRVRNLLIRQKRGVEVYAGFRGDYFLATGSCRLAVASSSYFRKALEQFPQTGFIIPQEGTFLTLENLAIPASAKNTDQVYRLINYLFRDRSVRAHFEKFGFFPATLQSSHLSSFAPEVQNLWNASQQAPGSFLFLREVMPQQTVNDIWVEVKSKN